MAFAVAARRENVRPMPAGTKRGRSETKSICHRRAPEIGIVLRGRYGHDGYIGVGRVGMVLECDAEGGGITSDFEIGNFNPFPTGAHPGGIAFAVGQFGYLFELRKFSGVG